MKTNVCLTLLLLLSHASFGQEFNLKFSFGLPDSVQFFDIAWVDADNDGLLDVMAFASDVNAECIIFLFKNDSLRQLLYKNHFNTGITTGARLITDFNADNMADVVVSGYTRGQPATSVFLNKGNFGFESGFLFSDAASAVKLTDLDQDGFREMLLSGNNAGTPFLHILKHRTSGWEMMHDSIKVQADGLEAFDFDADNGVDFFITGTDEAGARVSRAYYNHSGFYFTAREFSPALQGALTTADINHDGQFEILVAGKDEDNKDRFIALLNDGKGFTVKDTLMAAGSPQIFAADLDSDGVCDHNLFGHKVSGDTINLILTANPPVSVMHEDVITQAFGDGEHDGDLDLLQLTKNASGYGIRIVENTTPLPNLPPGQPLRPIAANIFDRLFMFWQKPSDDHTPTSALTFDVSIQSPGQSLMTADFDLFNGRRLTVSHGNNGAANYVLIHTAEPGEISFDIQAVDNSFHASSGSICRGSGGNGMNAGLCSDMQTVRMQLCKNEQVALASDGEAHWFSFKEGFLVHSDTLAFSFQEADTIFSLTYGVDCAHIKVYVLEAGHDLTKKTETDVYVCEGAVIRLGVEPDWAMVEWSSFALGFVSVEDSIDYVVTVPDTIKARVSDAMGCVIERITAVRISKPVIDVVHQAYQILRGENVQLSVSGGLSYQWSPASSVNDPTVANPVVSPLTTTEYSVVVSDSLGCQASARMIVMVEETAFVPNLFTPNHDGSNDALKVYGLGSTTSFSFTIYNREGSKVYQTNNIDDAINNGWNGTTGGVEQPSGVYYWRVNGQTATGKRLQLNGRISGSIVLVR